MQSFDAALTLVLPAIILLHLFIAPYTKVEESFNLQATHDISTYGFHITNETYDHINFPGAVPRTFVGALALSTFSRPIFSTIGNQYAQPAARAVLGLFNAFCLLRFRDGLDLQFGRGIARWYVLLQACQFHLMFYASRTLPNMFAFGLTTLAFDALTPSFGSGKDSKGVERAIYLFVFAGVIFRSEIALLLAMQLGVLLVQSKASLKTIVQTGILSAVIALVVSVPVDSYLWQKPLWPELWGFYFNAIEGKSAEWGVSPWHYYASSLLPKLLLNPLLLLLIPLALFLPATRLPSLNLSLPSLLFIGVYSLQPHKEARFIIYAVPPLTAAASFAASYIWTRRSKNFFYALGSLALVASVAGSFLASTSMLLISSLNYPGGEALTALHSILDRTPWPQPHNLESYENITIHMDVLSCMTGVTRFQQLSSPSLVNGRPTFLTYDKTEDVETLLDPAFWAQIDYALMEEPGKAIGKWDVVETIYGYSGIEILRPGDVAAPQETERLYAANNITVNGEAPVSGEVKDAAEHIDVREEGGSSAVSSSKRLKRSGILNLIRDNVRNVMRGWWIGPRMEPKLRILRRVQA